MIGGVLTLLAAASAPCSPTRLDACRDTNQLIRSAPFVAALRDFLGDARGSYLYDDAPMTKQATEVLGGPPDDPRRLADGTWLFTACRAHSCMEKGAVVLSNAGAILGFGILAFDCHKTPPGQPQCERGPTLTVFAPHTTGIARAAWYQRMVAWARNAADADERGSSGTQGPFQGVETRGILDERAFRRKR